MDKASLKTDIKIKMDKVIENLVKILKGFNTGRASPNLIEHIKVECYGDYMPISQLATVSVSDARTLSIQVWDKGMVKSIEKSISESGLGLNPAVDGINIRISIPALTETRRKELAKVAKSTGEDNKIAVRNIRKDAKDELKKLNASEDEAHKFEDELQKITEDYNKKIDKLIEDKSNEIMTI